MDAQPKKRGGQVKAPEERKQNNLTFRVRKKMRDRLESAAENNGWSISREIEARLQETLDRDDHQERLTVEMMRPIIPELVAHFRSILTQEPTDTPVSQ